MYNGKKIGVVILNYNDSETVIKLCSRIYKYKSIDKIVVVDNNSSDDSYKNLCRLQTLGLDILKCSKNGGYSSGNNFGANYLIAHYGVDIIFISNPDVEFSEKFVQEISSVLIYSNAKAASGIMVNKNGQKSGYTTKPATYLQDLLSATLLIKKIFTVRERISETDGWLDVEMLPGSLFAIDSNAFKDVGGFDERVFLYCEEAILGKRLRNKGYTLKLVTTQQFKHHHSTSINKSINRMNQVRQRFQSALYMWDTYGEISKFKLIIMKGFFSYGIWIRKIIFKLYEIIQQICCRCYC